MATRLSSIESKLTIYVLIFSILFGVLFSAVQIGVDYRGESQRYLNNTAELLERQSSPAALSLYNYDKRAMQAILESLLLNPAVVAARIHEQETNFEARAGLGEAKLNQSTDAQYYQLQSVTLKEPAIYSPEEKQIGQLQIWIDLRLTRQGFEQRAMLTLLLDVLRNVVLAGVLIWVFRLRLTRPLTRLMTRLMEIDPNKPQQYSLSVESSLRDSELDDLVSKMNALLTAMQKEVVQRHSAEKTVRQLNEQLEEKVRARTQALHDTNSQLQSSLDELQRTQDLLLQAQRMASMGHLAAGMAHEINNPIAVVYSNIATLSEYLSELIHLADQYQSAEHQIADKAMVSALESLRTSIDLDFVRSDAPDLVRTSRLSLERVRNIVSDLRTFADSSEMRKENVSLDNLVSEAVRELELDKSETVKVYQLLKQLPAVSCSVDQIRLVFRHILHNASDAMPSGGTIEIAGELQEKYVSVMIKDSGTGMSEEDLKCAVNPFFTRKEIGEGTGLGLTVAYNIMHNHGGELEIESELGKGTTVTLRFPVAAA